jgi:hypothetical protein
MRKSFEYAPRLLVHVQIYSCYRRYCITSRRPSSGLSADGTRQVPRQLVVLPFVQYAQIISICPLTFPLYSDMLSLSLLLWLPPTERREKAAERSQVGPKATRRPSTSPICANHSNMSSDLCFILGYAFAVVVIVVAAADEEMAAAAERTQAIPKATRRPGTSPICANHSNISTDLCFAPGYAFAIVVIVVPGRRLRKGWLATAHPLPIVHLDVWPLLLYAQIV